MNMAEEIKWHEAFKLLQSCEADLQVQGDGCDWWNVRMRNGAFEYESRLSPGTWSPWSNVGSMMSREWRRVPKAPSLHELAGEWRKAAASSLRPLNERAAHGACADELDAVLREGDYVSLKGVTAQELYGVWYEAKSSCMRGMDAVLAYLRSRGAK